jgi:flagellar biogenesis protein FliO
MSSISARIGVFVFATLALCSIEKTASGADPKVTRASHETVAKEASWETATPQTLPAEPKETKDAELTYSPQWPEPPNTGAMLLRLCVGTFVVLGLCVGSLWLGKPWLKRLHIAGTGNPSFFVEGSVAVGNRAMLHLVRVGGTQLVAGTDATGLKSLIALPVSFKDVLDEQIPDTEAVVATSPPQFDVRTFQRPVSKE